MLVCDGTERLTSDGRAHSYCDSVRFRTELQRLVAIQSGVNTGRCWFLPPARLRGTAPYHC
jgi:hypothetical protein